MTGKKNNVGQAIASIIKLFSNAAAANVRLSLAILALVSFPRCETRLFAYVCGSPLRMVSLNLCDRCTNTLVGRQMAGS